jgi:nitrite reductase (NO-forming)
MNAKRPSKVYPSKVGVAPARPSPKRVALALLFVLALAYALFVGLRSSDTKEAAPSNTPAANAAPQARELSLVLGDMFVEPRTLSITQGDSLKLVVSNQGKVNHDLIFSNGKGIRQLKPGEEDTIDFGVPDGSLTALCSLPGHADAGMKFSIYVTEP